jgi:hypothetical protein
MKTCTYCGRENDDAAVCCRECGIALPKEEPTQASLESLPPVIAATAPGSPAPSVSPRRPEVGGWLLLFCLSLTVFKPLGALVSMGRMLNEPIFQAEEFPGLPLVTVVDILIGLGLVGFGFYAGFQLWNVRPGCVTTAKQYLRWTLIYPAFVMVSPFMLGLPAEALPYTLIACFPLVFGSLLYFGIWYAYLNSSKRVKATYGV